MFHIGISNRFSFYESHASRVITTILTGNIKKCIMVKLKTKPFVLASGKLIIWYDMI